MQKARKQKHASLEGAQHEVEALRTECDQLRGQLDGLGSSAVLMDLDTVSCARLLGVRHLGEGYAIAAVGRRCSIHVPPGHGMADSQLRQHALHCAR